MQKNNFKILLLGLFSTFSTAEKAQSISVQHSIAAEVVHFKYIVYGLAYDARLRTKNPNFHFSLQTGFAYDKTVFSTNTSRYSDRSQTQYLGRINPNMITGSSNFALQMGLELQFQQLARETFNFLDYKTQTEYYSTTYDEMRYSINVPLGFRYQAQKGGFYASCTIAPGFILPSEEAVKRYQAQPRSYYNEPPAAIFLVYPRLNIGYSFSYKHFKS